METLHLTYDEVVFKIPYRNLLVMQRDKIHVVYDSDSMQEVTDEDFFKQKGLKFSE